MPSIYPREGTAEPSNLESVIDTDKKKKKKTQGKLILSSQRTGKKVT